MAFVEVYIKLLQKVPPRLTKRDPTIILEIFSFHIFPGVAFEPLPNRYM